jgi:hypothetical protein
MPSARETTRELRDFTVTARVIPISLLAIGIGVLGAFVALALMWLIGLFTNLFFFERWSTGWATGRCSPSPRTPQSSVRHPLRASS